MPLSLDSPLPQDGIFLCPYFQFTLPFPRSFFSLQHLLLCHCFPLFFTTPFTLSIFFFASTSTPNLANHYGSDFRTTKNREISTGPLTHLLTPLIHLFALHCSLHSCAPLSSFILSLAHSVPSSWDIKLFRTIVPSLVFPSGGSFHIGTVPLSII